MPTSRSIATRWRRSPHFTVQYESDRLYNGQWVDYFPLTLYDVDHDGKQEIITYGNADELPLPEETKKPETEEEKKRWLTSFCTCNPSRSPCTS